jgi:flagellar biosynthesis/type III secretory pathway M-ring protein FliF/YscJ
VPLDLRELEAADTRALEAVGPMPRLSDAERRALAPAAADSGVEGELTNLIEHQPEEVAQTLRSWLADRRT